MGVSDTHGCVEQSNPCLIQLGKLRGEGGGVVESGLYELDKDVKYGDASRSTTVRVLENLPLVVEGRVVDVRRDDGINVGFNVEP